MENKLKQDECGISVKLWGNQTKIASEDNPNEKLWISWRHVKIKKCKSCNINRIPLTKMPHFSEFLWCELCKTLERDGQEIKISTCMKKFHCCVKYTVFIKNENEVLKNSKRSNNYSRRYDILKSYPIGITFFSIISIQNNRIPIGYDIKMP